MNKTFAIFVLPYVIHPQPGYPNTPSEFKLKKSTNPHSCAIDATFTTLGFLSGYRFSVSSISGNSSLVNAK